MTSFIKKITFAVSLSCLVVSQSFAAAIEILYDNQSRTIGNLTLKCMANNTAGATASSSSSSTDYGQLVLTGLVGVISTAVIGPTVKARIIDPCIERFTSWCGVPGYCRRYSSENMDIKIDLLSPALDKSYRLLLENLDASLVDVGWGKYPVIDEDDRLVGLQVSFFG